MKNRCALYESGPVGEAAVRGTNMHAALAGMLGTEPTLNLFDLSEDDTKEVEWAYDHIKANTSETWPIEVEIKLSYYDTAMKELYFGTGDVVNGPNIYDLKTGEQHAYWHQMAGYALALMSEKGYNVVNISLLYSRYRKVKTYTITKEQAEPAILDILTRVDDPNAKPKANEFCGWCKKNVVCPEVKNRVNAINIHNDWKLENYNPTEIVKNPTELSKAIHLSRFMKKWVDAIDKISKDHEEIPGFKWKEVKGRKSLTDIADLFIAMGAKHGHIHLDRFLKYCSISMSNFEKYIMEGRNLSKKEAKEYIAKNFPDYIKENEPYKKLEEEKK